MLHTAPIWLFAESVDAERTERLLGYADFDEIVRMVADSTIAGFVWEPSTGTQLKSCNRASFLLRVPTNVYDAFFNSPVGYRAQYAADVGTGEAANRKLLAALSPRLLTFAGAQSCVSEQLLLASLRAQEAKLWIHESEVEAQLGEDCLAILYPPWQQASESGVGLLAPVGEELEVKGGWLDHRGDENRNPLKANRSNEIHSTGYS